MKKKVSVLMRKTSMLILHVPGERIPDELR